MVGKHIGRRSIAIGVLFTAFVQSATADEPIFRLHPLVASEAGEQDPSPATGGPRVVIEFPGSGGRGISEVEFTNGSRPVVPSDVVIRGSDQDPDALFDRDPTTHHTVSPGYAIEATFPAGADPDGLTITPVGTNGPAAMQVSRSEGGAEELVASHAGMSWTANQPQQLAARPSVDGGTLHMGRGWRRICGPTGPHSTYDRGTYVFSQRLTVDYCGLSMQAMGGTRYGSPEAVLLGDPGSRGFIVAAERWVIDNPDLRRYQFIEIWVKD